MAIGPVQLIVLGFSHPNFHGEIIEELERLHDSGTVRVIDALAVYKDANGELEAEHLSNLSEEEAIELRVWLRPVSRHDRVGEHSAVVCHWVNRTPAAAIRSMLGVSIGPP